MYGLFNTRSLTVVSMICKVTNPLLCYRICHHSSFTIIQQLWSLTSRSDAIICELYLSRINEEGSVRLGYSRNPRSVLMCLFWELVAGLLRLDLLLSKLSKAQSNGKFHERNISLLSKMFASLRYRRKTHYRSFRSLSFRSLPLLTLINE